MNYYRANKIKVKKVIVQGQSLKWPRPRPLLPGAERAIFELFKDKLLDVIWTPSIRLAFVLHLVFRTFLELLFIGFAYWLQLNQNGEPLGFSEVSNVTISKMDQFWMQQIHFSLPRSGMFRNGIFANMEIALTRHAFKIRKGTENNEIENTGTECFSRVSWLMNHEFQKRKWSVGLLDLTKKLIWFVTCWWCNWSQ